MAVIIPHHRLIITAHQNPLLRQICRRNSLPCSSMAAAMLLSSFATAFALLLLSVADLTSSAVSPSPSPVAGGPIHTPNAQSPAASPPLETPGSLPSPPPEAPFPSPITKTPAPVPNRTDSEAALIDKVKGDGEGSGGMNGGKKAAIAVSVILAAGILAAAAVYKKRRDNIRRSRYSYATHREIL